MRILGVDYGQRRMGFAVSDPTGCIAFPLRVIVVDSDEDAVKAVIDVCRETEAEKVIIGIPLRMDGGKSAMTEHVEAFIARIREEASVPVESMDERLTSRIAERALCESEMDGRKRRKKIDKVAAQILLQMYLDRQGWGP